MECTPKIIENLSDRLLTEARRQIVENGLAALNIRTLAKNCGVGVGTVYNYFPSKDALAAAVLAEDWLARLDRIRACALECGSAEGAACAMHTELSQFAERWGAVFASSNMPAPPKQYHVLLRSQLADVLLPFCGSEFRAQFASEALLTWTVEGRGFDEIWEILGAAADPNI